MASGSQVQATVRLCSSDDRVVTVGHAAGGQIGDLTKLGGQ